MKIASRINKFHLAAPLTLAVFALLAYGLLIPWLGLYADDWTFIWTFETLGTQGVLRYFTLGGNRPIWGLFYELTVPLLGHQPWVWHVFAIFWLWLCAVLVWQLVRLVWPEQPKTALIAALLFLLYPGLKLQYISLTFGHMWLIYAAFLGSLCCSLQAYRDPRRYLPWSALAVLLSAVNLLSFEYFIMLELLRPALLWIVFSQQATALRERAARTIKAWLPYLLLFIAVIVWRSFFFVLQTVRYQFSLFSELRAAPLATLLKLVERIFGDVFWQSTLRAWGEAFVEPARHNLASLASLAGIVLLLAVGVVAYFLLSHPTSGGDPSRQGARTSAISLSAAGLIALFAGGPPFWLTGLVVTPTGWNSRFTMPFMLGAALLFAGLIQLLPWQRIRWGAVALAVGFAVGSHFYTANSFRADWIDHNTILWQLSWRIPDLEPGTILLSNDLPLEYFSDNTLSAEINWIQAKGKPDNRADTYLAYISEMKRVGQPFNLGGQPVKRDMIGVDFFGSTGQLVGLYYRSGACLRVLDPRYDPLFFRISQELLLRETANDPNTSRENEYLAAAAALTKTNLILPTGSALELNPALYGAEPRTHWCYFYEKADLARQQGDWREVASLGDQFELKQIYLKRDPMLALTFIEGYARAGEIHRALEISQNTLASREEMLPVLCQVWQDLETSMPGNAEVSATRKDLGCR